MRFMSRLFLYMKLYKRSFFSLELKLDYDTLVEYTKGNIFIAKNLGDENEEKNFSYYQYLVYFSFSWLCLYDSILQHNRFRPKGRKNH